MRTLKDWAMEFPESRLAKTMAQVDEPLNLGQVDGGLECRRCKTKNPLIWQRQLRSADEPMTVFFLCRDPTCGMRWREG